MNKRLLTDLVIADMNYNDRDNQKNITFPCEICRVFNEYKVKSYFDLVINYIDKAEELRELAIKENLL